MAAGVVDVSVGSLSYAREHVRSRRRATRPELVGTAAARAAAAAGERTEGRARRGALAGGRGTWLAALAVPAVALAAMLRAVRTRARACSAASAAPSDPEAAPSTQERERSGALLGLRSQAALL